MMSLPSHLKKYIVEQDDQKYTPVDHAVWRYALRQLRNFLKIHAHECYLEGLEKTGIEIERIPKISDISQKIEKFGWRALPVSGFIPPAAFMELQSLGVLPIASDMRTLDHLMYTPAPDIIHEAAGHAPILVHPEFADYLRHYAQVARKAIINREDLDLYEAIRVLSDVKENPDSTAEEIKAAEDDLLTKSKSIKNISEATLLGRMNWWTAEYGLIGDMKNPKIFGAGLLSSVGESRFCLSDKVKKIPLSLDCIHQAYDITEPQPQLFVTPDFATLYRVLDEFASQMAYRQGGISSLEKVKIARTVNTVELNTGLQISGELKNFITHKQDQIAYLQFQGPCQLSYKDQELSGHDKSYHAQGFGTPLGYLNEFPQQCPSELSHEQWEKLGLQTGKKIQLNYQSGVCIEGTYTSRVVKDQKTLLITLKEARATYQSQTLFEPSWGNFDIALGSSIPSVYSGPADRKAFGEVEDFAIKKVKPPVLTEKQKELHQLFNEVRFLRENNVKGQALQEGLEKIFKEQKNKFPTQWLLLLETYELSLKFPETQDLSQRLRAELDSLKNQNQKLKILIEDGLSLARQ